MTYSKNQPFTDLQKLKKLLLGTEQKDVSDLQNRIKVIENFIGDDDKLRKALQDQLIPAVDKIQSDSPKELSKALSPTIVSAMQREIVNSKEVFVEALYPITGRLVSSAVSNAFRNLLENINARLDSLLSPQAFKLRIQSIFSKHSYAELVLAHLQMGQLQKLLIVDRYSGILQAGWAVEHDELEDTHDEALFAGLLSAVMQFAENALAEDNSSLKSLDLDGRRVFIETTSSRLIVYDTVGVIDAEDRELFTKTSFSFSELDDNASSFDENVKQLASELAAQVGQHKTKKKSLKGKIFFGLLIASLIAIIGWSYYQNSIFNQKIQEIVNAIYDYGISPAYPIHIVGIEKNHIQIRGIFPSHINMEDLQSKINVIHHDTKLTWHVDQIKTQEGTQQSLNLLSKDLKTLSDRLNKVFKTIQLDQKDLAENNNQLQKQISLLENKIADQLTNAQKLNLEKRESMHQQQAAEIKNIQTQFGIIKTATKEQEDSLLAFDQTLENIKLNQSENLRPIAQNIEGLNKRFSDLHSNVSELEKLVRVRAVNINEINQNLQHTAFKNMIMEKKIEFSNGANISDLPDTNNFIKTAIENLKDLDFKLIIIGHTDSKGSNEINQIISLQRANTVADLFIENGLSKQKIIILGRNEAVEKGYPIISGRAASFAIEQ